MKHNYRCQLRRSDMDAYRHVNNVVYVAYLEEARADMFGAHEPVAALAEDIVVARHRIQYVRPLVFRPEPVSIETWVSRIGTSSLTVEHEIRDGEAVYCRASSVIVPFDVDTQRARPIRPAEHAVLDQLGDG